MNTNVADLRDFAQRSRKAASLIMQTVSDKISITIESLIDDPMAMWLKLKNDYEQVSPALKQLANVDAIVTSTQLNSLHLSNTQLKLRTQLLLRLRSTQTQTQTHSHTH